MVSPARCRCPKNLGASAAFRRRSAPTPPGYPLPPDSIEYTSPPYPFTKWLADTIRTPAVNRVLKLPVISSFVNRRLQNKLGTIGVNRPYELSCKSDYTSWDSLKDRSYFGRHLPPKATPNLPPVKQVVEKLFTRKDGIQTMCPRSTLLFPTFAQHLIDSFESMWRLVSLSGIELIPSMRLG